MKLQGNPKVWTVTQTQFGQIIGVSQQRVSQLIDEQVLMKDETSKSGAILLIDSLREYYLSKQANKDGAESVNFWKERALNEKAKRELNEIKLEQARGNLYDAETVENVMAEILVNFRNKLTGVPNKLSPRLANKSAAEINAALTEELTDLLFELCQEFESTEFAEEVEDETEAEG